jgi:branched-chain amino acid aminotransferase
MNWTFINDGFVKEEDAKLHFRDLSILRGYGIFDFFKLKGPTPLFLDEHLDRFYASAHQMHLPVSFSRQELKDLVQLMIQKNDAVDCGIRLSLTGGYSPDGFQVAKPNFIISQHDFQQPGKEQFEKGIKLMTYEHIRQLPEVKSIDYLLPIWLQPKVKEQEADDILYHHKGIISECPRANFFIVTDKEQLITPSKNCLSGITRKKIMEHARKHFEVIEKDIQLSDLMKAKEAFITSTTKQLLPVRQIDHFLLPGAHPVAQKLLRLSNAE